MKFTALLNAALSAGALALPATNETEDLSTLERRANYGWVSSYAPSDPNCKGGWGGGRPKIKGSGCVKFQPISDHVGINWGSWPLSFNALDAFSDDNCQHQTGSTMSMPGDKKSLCVDISGQNWRSVRYHDTGYVA